MNALALVTAINDAAMLVTTLTPLVQRAMEEGRDVTKEELETAFAGLNKNIEALEAAILAAK